jgi:hypothetical protein
MQNYFFAFFMYLYATYAKATNNMVFVLLPVPAI